jgi:arylsulfatase A-like enzyme
MNPFIRMARMDRDFGLSLAHPTLSLGSTPGVAVAIRLLPRLYAPVPTTPELTRWAMDEIDAAGDQTEFLLWLHYYDPHDPYGPPDGFRPDMPEMQGDPDVAAPLSRERIALNSSAGGPVKVTPDRLQWIRGLYEGEAAFVDSNVARVLGLLRERGLYDDALIIVTSDHGEEMFEHGQFGHVRTLYDEVLRVPLMIKLPGNSVKRRIATPVETTSVLPTILEVAGMTYDPERFSAPSLTPLWSDADSSEWPPVYAYGVRGHDEPVSVIHNGRKLIFAPGQQHEQFFDLQADPGERDPQSGESFEHAQQLRDLLGAELERAEKMRAFYGIEKQSSKALDQDSADVLRSLGYIQ